MSLIEKIAILGTLGGATFAGLFYTLKGSINNPNNLTKGTLLYIINSFRASHKKKIRNPCGQRRKNALFNNVFFLLTRIS